MKNDTIIIKECIKSYHVIHDNPKLIKENELKELKDDFEFCIKSCKNVGIDYRAFLLKEVGDKRKVDAILKFYGVE